VLGARAAARDETRRGLEGTFASIVADMERSLGRSLTEREIRQCRGLYEKQE
jgi:hypothetical protein